MLVLIQGDTFNFGVIWLAPICSLSTLLRFYLEVMNFFAYTIVYNKFVLVQNRTLVGPYEVSH